MVTLVKARNLALGLTVVINDTVHYRYHIFLRKMTIKNLEKRARIIRIFFNHDFSLGGFDVDNTALYDPTLKAVYHYKRNRYFLVNGTAQGKGIFQYATGLKRFGTAEGTWRDAEDGWLEGNPIAQGSVDSTISFEVALDPVAAETLWYWLVMGENFREVRELNYRVLDQGPEFLLEDTKNYWYHWVNKQDWDFARTFPLKCSICSSGACSWSGPSVTTGVQFWPLTILIF